VPIETRAEFPTNWATWGEGANHALLLHCTMGKASAWRGVIKHLEADYTFIGFDMPGHGKSGEWHNQGDFHTTGTEIAKTFMDKPMDLVGHSYGGTIALRLALEVPNMVRSLVLIEPVLMNLAFKDDPSLKVAYDADHKEYNDALEAGDQKRAARAFAAHWGDGQIWQDLPQRSRDLMAEKIHMIKAGEHNVYGDRYGFSEPGLLNGINVPVLLIEGAQSHGIVGKINGALEHRLSHTSRIIVKEAGHMVPITHPVETAAAISRFWADSV
jgi:lipase